MYSSNFTPRSIIRAYRNRLIAGALLFVLCFGFVFHSSLPSLVSANEVYLWEEDDLLTGNASGTRVVNNITLAVSTSTADDTFDEMVVGNNFASNFQYAAFDEHGGVQLNQVKQHPEIDSTLTFEAIEISEDTGLLYLASTRGLYILDTQLTASLDDDVVAAIYSTSSTLTLNSHNVSDLQLDDETGLLYIALDTVFGSSTSGGVQVLDTKKNADPNDDVIVTTYRTNTTPSLINNSAGTVHYDTATHVLYVGGYGGVTNGLTAIDTKGTVSGTDDTIVFKYRTTSTPSILNGTVHDTYLNPETGLLYISTGWPAPDIGNGGLTVIDTKLTTATSDDQFLITYTDISNPALPERGAFTSYYDNDTGLLYVGQQGGVAVINTQQTATATDDELVKVLNSQSEPAIGNGNPHNFTKHGDELIINQGDGIYVIDTKGTESFSDDSSYFMNEKSAFAISYPSGGEVFVDDDTWYVGSAGLQVISMDVYNQNGVYQSLPRRLNDIPHARITVDAEVTNNQFVQLSYRLGTSSAVWRDDFDTADSYAGDLYDWDWELGTVAASDGILRVSNPIDVSNDGAFWIDSGNTDDYFELGSVVTASARVNTHLNGIWFYMFNDDWWDDDFTKRANTWVVKQFQNYRKAFSDVGFEAYSGDDLGTTTIEVDWLQIETPDSMGRWGDWEVCYSEGCVIEGADENTWIQYRLELSTSDPATTPVVHSVTYHGDYAALGTYTSSVETFSRSQDLVSFTADVDTPPGTAVSFEYTVDGRNWHALSADEVLNPSSPDILQFRLIPTAYAANETLRGQVADSFQWRATLTTNDPAVTPTINAVTLETEKHRSTESTAVAPRSAIGEAGPGATPASPEERRKEMVRLIGEVTALLEQLIRLRSEAN